MDVHGSSSITEMEWTEDDGLTVTFTNGRTYCYPDVPSEVWDGLTQANDTPGVSVGKAFASQVRGVYAAVKQ